jgi:tight adherence protein B
MFLILAFLIFSGALLAVGYYVWTLPEQQASQLLSGRLRDLRTQTRSRQSTSTELVRREERARFAIMTDFVAWLGMLRRVQEYIDQADLKYKAANVLALTVFLLVMTFLSLGALGLRLLIMRVLFSIAVAAAPLVYILYNRSRRLKKFEENLPDAIDLFTRTMKAGHNIHSGLDTIAKESLEPVRGEFRKVMEELALGSPIEPTLHNLGQRIPLIDLKFFITGLILQRQTGANMVSVLENLSSLVRERLNMAARLRAHTAQQRFSAGLLCLMPIAVALGFWVLRPEYIRLLYTDPTGIKFLTYAIISEILGILVIRRVANIRV